VRGPGRPQRTLPRSRHAVIDTTQSPRERSRKARREPLATRFGPQITLSAILGELPGGLADRVEAAKAIVPLRLWYVPGGEERIRGSARRPA